MKKLFSLLALLALAISSFGQPAVLRNVFTTNTTLNDLTIVTNIAQSVAPTNSGVTSVNGLTNDVVLSAGTNISIVTNGNILIISSAPAGTNSPGSATNVNFYPGNYTAWRLVGGSNVVDIVGAITNGGGGGNTNAVFYRGNNTAWRLAGGSNVVDVVGTLTNNTTGNAATANTAGNLTAIPTNNIVTNNETGVALGGTFTGNGLGLTVNASNITGVVTTTATNIYSIFPNTNAIEILPGSALQGMANNGTNLFLIDSTIIRRSTDMRGATAAIWATLMQITNALPNWSAAMVPSIHMGDADYDGGFLYCVMESHVPGQGAFSANEPLGGNTNYILIFQNTNNGNRYEAFSVSNYQNEVSGITVDNQFSNGSTLFVSDWANTLATNQIFEYTLTGQTNITFAQPLILSQPLNAIQGLQCVKGMLYLISDNSNIVWRVNPTNGQVIFWGQIDATMPEWEGVDYINGMFGVDTVTPSSSAGIYCYNMFGLPTIDAAQNFLGIFNGRFGTVTGPVSNDQLDIRITRTDQETLQAFEAGMIMNNQSYGWQVILNNPGSYYGAIGSPSLQVWSLGVATSDSAIGSYTSILGWTPTGAFVNGGLTNNSTAGFVGNGSGLTNVTAIALVNPPFSSAPAFAKIGSITNAIFNWCSNTASSSAPTNWFQYYDAHTNLTTSYTIPQ